MQQHNIGNTTDREYFHTNQPPPPPSQKMKGDIFRGIALKTRHQFFKETRALKFTWIQILYTVFLPEGLIFAYLYAYRRVNKNQEWQMNAAL